MIEIRSLVVIYVYILCQAVVRFILLANRSDGVNFCSNRIITATRKTEGAELYVDILTCVASKTRREADTANHISDRKLKIAGSSREETGSIITNVYDKLARTTILANAVHREIREARRIITVAIAIVTISISA